WYILGARMERSKHQWKRYMSMTFPERNGAHSRPLEPHLKYQLIRHCTAQLTPPHKIFQATRYTSLIAMGMSSFLACPAFFGSKFPRKVDSALNTKILIKWEAVRLHLADDKW